MKTEQGEKVKIKIPGKKRDILSLVWDKVEYHRMHFLKRLKFSVFFEGNITGVYSEDFDNDSGEENSEVT